MAAIGYLVPYEIRVRAADTASGKLVSNVFYVKSGTQLVAPPAYGAPIAGSGSTTTLLASFRTLFNAGPLTMLEAHYVQTMFEMRKIVGWKYNTPIYPITAVAVGNPTVVASPGAITLTTGQLVNISGITGATSANGTWTVGVVGAGAFSINANTTGELYGGGGQFQKANGALQFSYEDLELLESTNAGGISGEAAALFGTASVRRIGSQPGKSFQGRNSYSPIPESTVESGGFTTAAKASWVTALDTFNDNYANGGSETPGSGNSVQINVSKMKAFTQVTPFVGSLSWTSVVTQMLLQPDQGTMLRRKPRLSSVIIP